MVHLDLAGCGERPKIRHSVERVAEEGVYQGRDSSSVDPGKSLMERMYSHK